MADEVATAPESAKAPGHGDETTPEEGQQSTASETQSAEAGSVRPSDSDSIAQPEPQEDYQKRFRDTQRALSEKERRLEAIEAELKVYREVAGNRTQTTEDEKLQDDMAKMEEDVRSDPANAVKHFYRLLAARDQYFQGQLAQVRFETERRVVESSPEFAQVREGIEALQDVQDFKFLPPQAQVAIVSRLQKKTGQRSLSPPSAPVGSRRASPPPQKEQTPQERWKAHLIASGAIRGDSSKRSIPFVFER